MRSSKFREKDRFAIILAAGRSRRMGMCKTQLEWKNSQNLLQYQIEQFLLFNIHPVVVLGKHNACYRIDDYGQQVTTIINLEANLGKTTSIFAGLQEISPFYELVVISTVDQPRDAQIYQQLIQEHQRNQALITVPTYEGKIGHPIVCDRRIHGDLMGISEEKMGLRQIIHDFSTKIHPVVFSTSEILIDINTPSQYQNAWHKFVIQPAAKIY